jgi:hypothetical protein
MIRGSVKIAPVSLALSNLDALERAPVRADVGQTAATEPAVAERRPSSVAPLRSTPAVTNRFRSTPGAYQALTSLSIN